LRPAGLQTADDAQLERHGPVERLLAVPDRAPATRLLARPVGSRAEQRIRRPGGAADEDAAVLLPEAARPLSACAADVQGWQSRAERYARANPDAADHSDVRHCAGAVDRHGQRGEPAA